MIQLVCSVNVETRIVWRKKEDCAKGSCASVEKRYNGRVTAYSEREHVAGMHALEQQKAYMHLFGRFIHSFIPGLHVCAVRRLVGTMVRRVYDFGFYLHFLWRQSVNTENTRRTRNATL